MTTSTRTSGTSINRILGTDGSSKYQAKVGTIVSLVTLPVVGILTKRKVAPVPAAVITAAITTVSAVAIDKNMDSYYTPTEYVIMFGMLTGLLVKTFKTL